MLAYFSRAIRYEAELFRVSWIHYSFVALVLISYLVFLYKGTIAPVIVKDWGIVRGWDGAHYYAWMRSLFFDFDVSFANDIEHYSNLTSEAKQYILSQSPTSAGLLPNKYSVGWAIMATPSLLVGHLASVFLNAIGYNLPTDGYSYPYQLALIALHVAYTIQGIVYLSRFTSLVSQKGGDSGKGKHAFPIAWMVWAASPLLFYQSADITMAHGVTFFCLTGLYYFTTLAERSGLKLDYFFSGLYSGLLFLCRPQAMPYLLYPVWLMTSHVRSRRWSYAGVWCLPVLCCCLLYLLCLKAVYGSFFMFSYQGEHFDFLAPKVLDVMFSPFHGLFFWHPILLVGALCSLQLAMERGAVATCLFISVLVNILINASWYCWWFGASFGQRALEGAVLLSALGIHDIMVRGRTRIVHALYVVLICFAIWNINLTSLVVAGALPLDRPVEYREMIGTTIHFYRAQLQSNK